jgi:TonB-dependent starch-binding outer membrane protein SusC
MLSMRIRILLVVLSVGFFGVAQQRTISGTVLNDAKEPLGFVKISSKSPKANALSASDGTFSFQLKDTSKAIITLTIYGYLPQDVELGAGDQSIVVTLKPEFSDKKEVTVIGYGEAKNKTITGATSKVGGEDIEKMNMSRMDQALQGQMAGVNISTNSGSPGGSANIRIRGLGTFGDNDPLILVDGIVYDSQGLNALNPSDIKSITVLKDAMAGIYGVRAANGVVLIETKNGAINRKPTIEYNGYFGLQETSKKLDLLHADEYAVIKNEMFAMGGQNMLFYWIRILQSGWYCWRFKITL